MTDAFDFDAYLRLPRLSGLRASPDGTCLSVTVGRPAPDGRKMHSSLWELDPSGDERRARGGVPPAGPPLTSLLRREASQPDVAGTRGALQPRMFALIRRFIIGWLLVRLVRRLTAGSTRTPRR